MIKYPYIAGSSNGRIEDQRLWRDRAECAGSESCLQHIFLEVLLKNGIMLGMHRMLHID